MIYNFINKYKHFYIIQYIGLIFDFFHTPLALSHHQTYLFDVSSSFIVAVVFAYIYIYTFPIFLFNTHAHIFLVYYIHIHKHTHICHFYITSIVNIFFQILFTYHQFSSLPVSPSSRRVRTYTYIYTTIFI